MDRCPDVPLVFSLQWICSSIGFQGLFVEDHRRSADAALAVCRALPFVLHLRLVRLDYLCCLAIHGPEFLLVALDVLAPHPFSFASWIFEPRGKYYGMPDPRLSLPDAVAWVSASQKRWKK